MRGAMKLSEFAKSDFKKESGEDIKENLSKSYDELKDLSQDDLYNRLKSEVDRQKRSGEFNKDALLSSLNAIRMYLPNETYENMIRTIDEIDGKN